MSSARVYVDFNEMPSPDTVLLSQDDRKLDSSGQWVHFAPGDQLGVFMDDWDATGERDNLIADGIVILNPLLSGGPASAQADPKPQWRLNARWWLQIDPRGIRHESDLA
jgi:hypothetical protein